MKSILRLFLANEKIRNIFCFLRAFYFCRIKKEMKNLNNVTEDTWKNTLGSNQRAIYDKNINLPKHPRKKSIFDLGTSHSGGKSNWLLAAIKHKYKKHEIDKLKILSIGPRSEGEIFNLFSYGFELKNITGVDLFTYSPLIKLSDMHELNLQNEQFDIVLMGWCLAYSNNKSKAISEAKRVLKKNGSLIIGYSVSNKTDEEIEKERGYLVGSPFDKISSMNDLDSIVSSIGFEKFYSKIIDKITSKRLIYAATK